MLRSDGDSSMISQHVYMLVSIESGASINMFCVKAILSYGPRFQGDMDDLSFQHANPS